MVAAVDSRNSYEEFIASKIAAAPAVGIEVDNDDLHESLYPFQRDLVRWSLRKGRAALFADTGLGKTLMQLEWAKHAAERTLILAPLAVALQTEREAKRWGIPATYARSMDGSPSVGITVTNYEMADRFDPAAYGAVVLDESSILKSFDGKTRTQLIDMFGHVPYRLACTATPAPNDIAEMANHAEFLGVLSRVEMLATFFVHDQDGWRLKGHGRDAFYRWLASWGMSIRKPSDLGYPNDGYDLPGLRITPVIVPTEYVPQGQLFATALKGVTDRGAVRRQTLDARCDAAAELVNGEPEEQWIVWVGLNDESDAMAERIPGAVAVSGSDSPEEKAKTLASFADGEIRVLVTKPSIAGFGLNFQRCARMVFVGIGDSYEQYYQSIRRCFRFGQQREVGVWIVLSEPEEMIFQNVQRKEQQAREMADELVRHVGAFTRAEIESVSGRDGYEPTEVMVLPSWMSGDATPMNVINQASGNQWTLFNGDSAEVLRGLPEHSIDFSVFSPPFMSLYTYSASDRDLGNNGDAESFWNHFSFISEQLLRVMKPGRLVAVHVSQLTTTKAIHGEIGLTDFRGGTIRHFINAGFIHHGEVVIDKDPQAQAIRTKSKSLLFVQLERDASWLRPALADFILVFRAPGENAVPVHPDISRDDWIEWARPIWYGIRESDTLNVAVARENDDERHICPLQLGTIERCVRLWSNAGETVLSPFAGIGSEGYESIRHGRNFVGVELKPSYWRVAAKNLERAELEANRPTLFAMSGVDRG